jgi:diguanylate cyclase (GGDEF)-like protein
VQISGIAQLDEKARNLTATGDSRSATDLARANAALKARVAELERLVACDTLDRWCWRAHRYGGHYGLLYIDVDNLKSVNDRHGHLAGDVLLTSIAKALLGTVRRSDLIARIGGDEFAILLDNIQENELARKADRVAAMVGKLKIPHDGAQLAPSISAGYAVIEPGVKPSELLLRADRSMYAAKQAKEGGRAD